MLIFTTKIKTLCLCAISLLFSSAVLADTYPTSDELIGRYHFSGKCSVEAPSIPAVNDYVVIILPAEGENNLYVCGLFGFGGGMFTGSTCGALVGSIAALSKLIIKTKAHDQLDEIRPYTQKCIRNFKEELGNVDCALIKPVHHTKETKCLNTCFLAAKALEKTIYETVGR